MEKDDLLRVQDIAHAFLETSNEHGPITFHLLSVIASPLFARPGQATEAQRISLALDARQMAHLREWLARQDLPATEQEPRPSIQ